MNINEIISRVDHTLLKQDAVWDDIKLICDEAIEFSAASVCIPPAYVKKAVEYAAGRIPVCTVIGFPNGYSTPEAKCFEAADAINNGAKEIDVVINIGSVKNGDYNAVLEELKLMRKTCKDVTLKVIIETCLLTDDEKVRMCRIVSESGADYIKTSTGFSTGGATFEDIELLAKNISTPLKIKASGGISSFEDAERFIELGADRLGTSRLIKMLKKER